MSLDDERTRLDRLGAGHEGCVTASQLAGDGFSPADIDDLVERGVLSRVFPGVFVIDAESLSDRQFKWAALLLGGNGSALSHYTALALHGLIDPDPSTVWLRSPLARGERTLTTKIPVAATKEPGTVRLFGPW
ncbi:MAG: type IV toxin-antitoxin system AbiEi family antitoxin domain-containing protein [Solirubrobacteraceae bacterium]|nr:type IV toxin-antitoxin system AbiEi family antitoxin domain-containing protein [Solirubrobacteraceae bacterium]